MVISYPTHWKEAYFTKGTKYDKIVEIIDAIVSGNETHHGGLIGLGDDDHPQYLLVDGSRSLSADWDAGSFKITAEQLESDIVTGTTPFIVASTTLVSNLNADLLDGVELSAIAQKAVDETITGKWTFDTDTGNKPVQITRLGLPDQGLSIYVDDLVLYFNYSQDEPGVNAHRIWWDILTAATGNHEYSWFIKSSPYMNLNESGLLLGNANARITTIYDEDAMGSDSATALATQQSIKAYIDSAANGTLDHGLLFGLGDNDHPQYPRIAIDESITGEWTFDDEVNFAGGTLYKVAIDGDAHFKESTFWTVQVSTTPSVPSASAVNLGEFSNKLRIQTASGYTDIGAEDANYSYFRTDIATGFYFEKNVLVDALLSTAAAGDIDDAVIGGSANSAWVPCSFNHEEAQTHSAYAAAGIIGNTGGVDFCPVFILHLPTSRGSKSLFIKGVKVGIFDADANDLVSLITIFTTRYDDLTQQYTSGAITLTTPQEYSDTFTAFDCSAWDVVSVTCETSNIGANQLDIVMPLLECYYA